NLVPPNISDIKGDRVERYEITPEDFGFSRATFDDIKGGDPAFNAHTIREIFEGRDRGPRRDFLVINNGYALYVAGAAAGPEEGMAKAPDTVDSVALAQTMAGRPVAGISVVTEPREFGGSVDLLRKVTAAVDVPVLRKDFVRDRAGLEETVAAGAAAILLTVSMTDRELFADLHDTAKELGLETLVEVHDGGEIEWVRAPGLEPDILGINNWDLVHGEVDEGDVSLTEDLVQLVPEGWLVLS